MEQEVFDYLASLVSTKVPYNTCIKNISGNALEGGEAIVSLCAKGLIELRPHSNSQEFIQKTSEFYKAENIGFERWNFLYNRSLQNDRDIARWNLVYYQFRSQAARYWWISIPLSLVAIAISLFKAFS